VDAHRSGFAAKAGGATRPAVNQAESRSFKESVSMRGVSGILACVALLWAVVTATSVLAQAPAPAGPAAVPAEAKKLKAAFPSSPQAIEAGKQLYAKYCRFCHGNTGAGDSTMAPKTMKPSNLTAAEWVRGSSEGEIFWVLQNGAPPKYDMKGLKGKLTDADLWNLVHFVRSLGGAGK
jgi:mono/diheme cytochrome c family protein